MKSAERASAAPSLSRRAVVLARLGRDAVVLTEVLQRAGVAAVSTPTFAELSAAIRRGVDFVLLTTESLTVPEVAQLNSTLAEQPPWSDVPVLLLLPADAHAPVPSSSPLSMLIERPGVIVLHRPVPTITLLTSVHSSLSARRRQYQLRDLLLREHRAREQAEAAARMKDEFLAVVSHELRTPLTAILIWARMLVDRKLHDSQAARGVASMLTSAEALAKLVEDLLDMARTLSGKLRIEAHARQLGPILSATLDIVRPTAEARNIQLNVKIDARSELVLVDADRAQQMFWNLLSNAIKFTPRGGLVSVRLTREQNDVCVTVSDTGQGIALELLPHIFERFRQEDTTLGRRHGGLGLGLAIVRQLVELHGGEVSVESEGKGKGARFTIRLPVAAEESSRRGPPERADACGSQSLYGVRVLLAEDDSETRLALSWALENAGATVTAVPSGSAALSMINAAAPGHRPHVLVSDVAMPGMDGIALIEALRKDERLYDEPRMPAIALTAHARDEERKRVLEAGFDAHLTKPLVPSALESALRELLGRDQTRVCG